MKRDRVPGAGGVGSHQGDSKLNKHLQTQMRNVERSVHTQDDRTKWPSMWDLAKKITGNKQ